MSVVHDLAEWMLSWAESPLAAWALGFFAFIESIFFPIPPDPLLITLGIGQPSFALVFAAICTAGSVSGAVFGYLIGQKGGKPVAVRLFGDGKVSAVARLYQKYDVWAVALAAFTPLPYKVFSVTAGVSELNLRRFILASIVGRGGRFFLVGTLIMLFGDTIRQYLVRYIDLAGLAFVVLLVGGFVVVSLVSRARAKRADVAEGSPTP